jgi:hypothetical protein
MATQIIFSDNTKIIIDATTSQEHERSASITKNKVEEGANVADHQIANPKDLKIDGIISNFTDDTDAVKNPHIVAFMMLESAWLKGELLTIVTTRQTYKNMIITKLSMPVKPSTGKAFVFSLSLEEISFAHTETVKVPKQNIGKEKNTKNKEENKKAKRQTQKRHSEKKDKGQSPVKDTPSATNTKATTKATGPKSAESRSSILYNFLWGK